MTRSVPLQSPLRVVAVPSSAWINRHIEVLPGVHGSVLSINGAIDLLRIGKTGALFSRPACEFEVCCAIHTLPMLFRGCL
jgi:hypothetical protein